LRADAKNQKNCRWIMRLATLLALLGWALAPIIAPAQSTNFENAEGVSRHATSGIHVGSMTAFPGIDVSIGHDDNLTRQPTNQISSPVVFIAPYVILEGRSGAHVFDLRYRGRTARYSNSPDDNFNNNNLQANANLKFGVRNDVALHFDLLYGSDPRGSTDRPITDSPDRYRQIALAGRYGYGARGAKGRIEVDATYRTRRYTNNPQAAAESDVDATDVGATFYWRVKPKTRLLFEGRYRDYNYINPGNTLGSNEQLFYVGAQWDATAKTSGFVKYGHMWKNFAYSGDQNDSTNSWDVGIRWRPRTYSVFDLSALKRFDESTGVGDTIVERRTGIGWTHAWNSRLSHNLSYAHIRDTYLGAGTNRRDETNAIGVKINYQFRRWARFGAEFTRTDRDSNEPMDRYRRDLLLFTVALSL
jgi:polysaccharide biosynthesis protein VpsM